VSRSEEEELDSDADDDAETTVEGVEEAETGTVRLSAIADDAEEEDEEVGNICCVVERASKKTDSASRFNTPEK